MARRTLLASGLLLALATSGCMMVDKAVDPVGYENGTFRPIFPWYPAYLFNRDMREYGRWWRENPTAMEQMRNSDSAHPAGCACCSPETAD